MKRAVLSSRLLAAAFAAAVVFSLCPPAYSSGAATIHGTVSLEPGGRATPGVWVRLRRVGEVLTTATSVPGASAPRLALADVHGKFAFPELAPGIYEIAICRDSLSGALAPASHPSRAVIVSHRDRAEVHLHVTHLATIEGRVWMQGSAPARGGRVQAFQRGEAQPFADCLVGDDGRFTIHGVTPGTAVQLLARTRDGVWQRTTMRPLRPGPWPFDFSVPSVTGLARRAVRVAVVLPFAQERPLELVWSSEPPERDTGYESVVALNGEGRCEFLSPTGVFRAEVREIGGGRRVWKAPRLYRVDTDRRDPMQAVVHLEPTTIR
jgi:hypothetical protein